MNAARVGRTFSVDPLVVLAGSPARVDVAVAGCPWVAVAIRVAAHNVIVADEKVEG